MDISTSLTRSRMACKRTEKSCTVLLATVVILVNCLAPTIHSLNLRKAYRSAGRRDAGAAATIGVQKGKILFGKVFEKGSPGIEVDAKQVSSNASVEDETAYQADYAGKTHVQPQDATSTSSAWKRMSPSVQCSEGHMKLRAMGPGASQFVLDQGSAPPLSLSQVPQSCGYNMQRNSLGLVMVVPYNGCNMMQESGCYVLPMRWQGIPVSLLCPKPGTSAAAPTAAPTTDPTTAPEPPVIQTGYGPLYQPMPQMHGLPTLSPNKQPPAWPGKLPFPYGYPPQHPPTAAPVSTTKATTAKKPQIPYFSPHHHYYPPFYPQPDFPPSPATTTTQATTTTARPAAPAQPHFPYPMYPPFPFPPFFPGSFPHFHPTARPTAATTTTTVPTTTSAKPATPATPVFPYPFYPPFPFPPFYPGHGHFPHFQPTTRPTTTTTAAATTTTTVPTTTTAAPVFPPFFPYFPQFGPPVFPPFMPGLFPPPTSRPTTTASSATTTATP